MNRCSIRLELLARLQMGTMSKRMGSKERDPTSLPTMFQFFFQLIFSDNVFCEYYSKTIKSLKITVT